MLNGRFKTTVGNFVTNYINILHKTEVQTSNDHLNLNFARRGLETAILHLQILENTLYVIAETGSVECPDFAALSTLLKM